MSPPPPPARGQLLRYGVRAPRPLAPGIHHGIHSTQLRAAVANQANSASASKVTVVFAGDSTSLLSGNQAFHEMETIAGAVEKRLRRQNPGVAAANWNFINRGIGGTTWSHFAGTPTGVTFPSWYTSTGQPWITTYISPASAGVGTANAPDLIVICLGTNDLDAIAYANIRNALNTIANTTNFPITPDVWLCTTTGRTADLSGSTQAQIDGVQMAAAASRFVSWGGAVPLNSTYTKAIGLLDFARMDAICRLGFDPARQVLEDVPSLTNVARTIGAAVPFTLAECDGDFDLQMTFPGGASGSTIFANGGNVRFVCSPAINGGLNENEVRLTRNTTLIASTFQGAGGLSPTLTNSTLGTGDIVLRIIAQQNEMTVFCQNTRIMDTASVPGAVTRGHGRFTPRVYFSIEPPATTLRCDFFRAGRRLQYAPTILETQAWDRDGSARYGGGSVNHPSSYQFAEAARAVLDAQNFCVSA